MSNLALSPNEALFNQLVRRFYQDNASSFQGSFSVMATSVAYQARQAPTVQLTAPAGGTNLRAVFSEVAVRLADGDQHPLQVAVTGLLQLQGGRLSLTSLTATVTGAGAWLDKRIAAQVEATIGGRFAAELGRVDVSRIQNVFNSGMTVGLESTETGPGQCTVRGTLSRARTNAPPVAAQTGAPPPTPAPTPAGVPALGLALNSDGVAAALAAQAGRFPISRSDERSSTWGLFDALGAGIRATATLRFPTIALDGGSASVVAPLSFSVAGGIKTGFWTWVGIPVPDATAAIYVTPYTDAAKREAGVRVTGLQRITVNINWPLILKPVGDTLAGFLTALLDLLHGTLSSALVGTQFEVFSFPAEWPRIDGIAIRNSTLQAVLET